MKRLIIGILMLGCAGLAGLDAYAAPKGWETVKTERTDAKEVAKDSEVTVKTFKGGLAVTTNHPVQIKVFTILGQLVSSETIPAGTSQLILSQRGMYIVKVGDITCKIVV